MKWKKHFISIIIAALLFANIAPNLISAQGYDVVSEEPIVMVSIDEIQDVNTEEYQQELYDELNKNLIYSDDSTINIRNIEIYDNELFVQTTFESEDLKADLDIKFDSESEDILIDSVIEENGTVEQNQYRVTMQQLEDDHYSTIFTNLETDETFESNPVRLQASIIPAIVYRIGSAIIQYTITKIGTKKILKIGKRSFYSKSKDAAKKAVANFTDITLDVGGGKKVIFTKAKMRHILENHHPNYWTGNEGKSFFDPDLSVNDIKNIVTTVINKNKVAISKGLKDRKGVEALAKVNGIEYRVFIKKQGYVSSAYPIGR
ncbi:SAR2788 family putative toxin [Lysinibacillus sp. FSL K6-3209]|uniref:SAR2788 family putative toxin n=1 Tax=Lysinibacillus sp. FSL K6-3209 TaxID=2921497 RepID=UPI0030DC78ED